MTGAQDQYDNPVKKPTECTTNSETLVRTVRKFLCDGSHIHGHPIGAALEQLKQYSWKLRGA
eukprot:6544131-Lingulodinium_polyedra.AAC.1